MRQAIYQEGYRYVIRSAYTFQIPHGCPIDTLYQDRFLEVVNGQIILLNGYASDGPTGLPHWPEKVPLVNRFYKRFADKLLRGSFEHDGIYQLIRLGVFGPEHRIYADRALAKTWTEDKVSKIIISIAYRLVRSFGGNASKHSRQLKVAPRILP